MNLLIVEQKYVEQKLKSGFYLFRNMKYLIILPLVMTSVTYKRSVYKNEISIYFVL